MSLNLTSDGLDQLMRDLRDQGYSGSRPHLEHLVLKASSVSGMGLLRAGLEQLVLEKRFDEVSVESFRQVVEFWSQQFVYATVRVDHTYRFEVLLWKPVDPKQVQETARFFLSMASGHGEIFMKLRGQSKPERRLLQLEPARQVRQNQAQTEAAAQSLAVEAPVVVSTTEAAQRASQPPAAWAQAMMDEFQAPGEGLGESLGGASDTD